MKKIFSIIAALTLVFSAYAQDARQRTTETIVADVLAAMPVQNSSQFNEQMRDLSAAAPESIVKVADMLKPAGEGVKNNIYEYALSGVVAYVTDPAHNENATKVLMGLQQAAAKCSDATNKAFIESLERYLKPEETSIASSQPVKAPSDKDAIQDKCSNARAYINAQSEKKGMKVLDKALSDENIQYRNAVLGYATEKYGVEKLAPTLLKKYPKASEGTKVDLLNWFGNNKVTAATDIVGGAINDASQDIALAAMKAASKIGGEGLGKELIDIISKPASDEASSERAEVALTSLLSFKGNIENDVVGAIESGSELPMQLASTRKMHKAYPAIFKIFKGGNDKAAEYLQGVVGPENIQEIGNELASASKNIPQLQNALYSCVHTLAPQEQYSRVKALMDKASSPENFYDVLARTGVDAAVNDLDKAYSEGSQAALDGLLEIDNFKAAPILLNIAKKDASKIGRVLPRYIDLVNTYEQNLDKKRFDLKSALEIANTKELKTKALNALSGIPTMKAFLLAGQYLDDKDASYAAANAVKNIANKTTEEINYADLKTNLEKAAQVFNSTGDADDGYAVKEIETLLSKAQQPSPVSQLTEEEKKQGFEMLFDGTNLDKFQGDKEGYTPVNGVIKVSAGFGSTGNLYTLNEYRNFVYRFEFRFTKEGANNGVGVRTPMGVDAAYDGMCEVQILDHDAPMYANLHEYQVHGSVYGVIPAKRIKHKPLGEWETEEIRVEGNHVKVTVNGEVIVDGDVKKACKGHNVAPDGSNYNPYTVDHRNHPGMFNKKGYVSFCGHGEGVELRNVRILDLGNRK